MTADAVRRLNTYDVTGRLASRCRALDDMIIEHLETQRELSQLNRVVQGYVRLAVEGFSQTEIATELGVSRRSLMRILGRAA